MSSRSPVDFQNPGGWVKINVNKKVVFVKG